MYAPKDDTKHRAKWRQLYDEKEANELSILINEAESNGIDFYYSLAPGLDMTYSSQEDLNILKQKFDQLRSLGCRSFAILFDDIEPRIISEKDKSIFSDNYAQAQVSVTNIIYEYLNKPKFLFCPTEYCESRAVPSVQESLYLNTIGSGLHQGIDFMWSGSRVVSRYITEESIQELSQVIRRPPVIWENLHANDYDKKRVYLGPYSGRSTKIIPKLRGVLTNPNCEYEANYIAIHTLAQWSRCTEDVNPHNKCNQDAQMATAINCFEQQQQQNQQNDNVYDPDRALVRAIRDWLPHVLSARSLPQGDESMTRNMRDDTVAEIQITKEVGCDVQHDEPAGEGGDNQVGNIEVDMLEVKPSSLEDLSTRSGASKTSSDMDTSNSPPALQSAANSANDMTTPKPMNAGTNVDANSSDSYEMQDVIATEQHGTTNTTTTITNSGKQRDTQPIVDCIVCSANNIGNNSHNNNPSNQPVDLESLALVVDFFYLPFEHGLRGHALLSDIKWLIDNSGIFITDNVIKSGETKMNAEDDDGSGNAESNSNEEQRNKEQQATLVVDSRLAEVWLERAERLNNLCNCINRIISTLIHHCPNKLITAELYPYLAELRDVIFMTTDYIKFLHQRRSSSERFYFSSGPRRREHFAPCDEQEPWVHRGGLIGDMQRLIS